MMRSLNTVILLMIGLAQIHGQVKQPQPYQFPAGSTVADYLPGKVLVKVKPQYRDLFQSSSSKGRSSFVGGVVRPLVPATGNRRNASARAQAFKPVIDITQYFEIAFDDGRSTTAYIEALYRSGYVEYAEPVFRERMQFEPGDALLSSQYYLAQIKAYEAWDITQGSEAIIIGIIDSGGDLDHPDLASQLYINTSDPVNGIDDDNNGYVDDYRGWDFSGADTLNVFDPDFAGDNDPSVYKSGPGFIHGTAVGACASAATDNATGMAGVGFKTKLLYTKHFADNQKASSKSYNSNLYLGVLYAAQMGARIINCSWGSSFRSQVYQDMITHVTLDLGCMVVAAAGNDGVSTPLYPAAYDYVLSVASTDETDKRASFSNYGNTIDISAPGDNILTAVFDDNYETIDGTSLSSPIVAGAAALVLAHHPDYTPLQLAEQLRVTADKGMYDQNPGFLNKLGKGRLDIARALTTSSPSIRALNYKLVNADDVSASPGDVAYLSFDFRNYLESSSAGLEITISTTSSFVAITKNKISPGSIPSGTTINNQEFPFELTIDNTVPENNAIELMITYSDGVYEDYQVFSFIPNPSFRHIDDNLVLTSISSTGRLGYEDPGSADGGYGFVFNDKSLLYEMGVIMGGSSSTVLNTVRNGTGGFDTDFVSLSTIREIVPGERSYAEVFGNYSNSPDASNQNVVVSYRSMVWREAPYDHFVIIEYKIRNPKSTPLDNFHFGMFADWDISFNGAEDAARWNEETKMGYVFPKQSAELPHAGIQLLTGESRYYAIDNDGNIAGNPFGIYDGFTDNEKFLSISTSRAEAGNTTAGGNDVSHVVAAGPYTIDGNGEITIAFALHAGNNFDELVTSARYADSLYNFTLVAVKPSVDSLNVCHGDDATLTAGGGGNFKWYTDFTGGLPIATGPVFALYDLSRDTTLYVSNAGNSFESVRVPAHVSVQAQPKIAVSGQTTLCEGDEVTLTAADATAYLWSNSETTQSITVGEEGEYSLSIRYDDGVLNCESGSDVVTIDVLPRPEASFTISPAQVNAGTPVQFTDESAGATRWLWEFGDGETSEEQHPLHTFQVGGTVEVTLTITAVNGCDDTATNPAIITGSDDDLNRSIKIYPVPARQQNVRVVIDAVWGDIQVTVLDAQGRQKYKEHFRGIKGTTDFTLPADHYAPGVYFLIVQREGRQVVRKVIIQ